MWRWYTAEDRRNATAVLALLTILGVTLIAATPILTGMLLTAAVRPFVLNINQ